MQQTAEAQKNSQPRKITPDQIERIKSGRPVSSWLPIRAASGQTITEFECGCNRCGCAIPDEQTSVICTEPIPGVQVIDGFAICWDCRGVSQILLRFMPDGRFEGPDPKTGRWSSWRMKRSNPAWWDLAGWLSLAVETMVRRRIAKIIGKR